MNRDSFEKDYFYTDSNYSQNEGYQNLREDVVERTRYVIKKFLKGLSKEAAVLCLGTAYGFEVEAFTKEGFSNVWGCDISKHAIKEAKKTYPALSGQFSVDDAQELRTKKSFDLIYAFDIIEHLERPSAGLNSWVSRLKKSGKIFIATPEPCNMNVLFKLKWTLPKALHGWLDNDPTHISILPQYKWEQFFVRNGIKVILSKNFVSLTKNKRFLNILPLGFIQTYLLEKIN